jgi:hypothetical protein
VRAHPPARLRNATTSLLILCTPRCGSGADCRQIGRRSPASGYSYWTTSVTVVLVCPLVLVAVTVKV